ncbi:MAG: transcriptional regulator, TraR/DksA family [Rhodobacteraceae bacterium HLUCCA12]|nr:MAG: transcriptional regulator, TraR/DksA family [Rhodobacteraceae bacterium HLUCCA12]
MTTLPQDELDRRKAQLLARLDELDTRIHDIEAELRSHDSKDWEEMATERENDEVLSSMESGGLNEARMIQAALERIESGEYGFCTRCGAEIAPERLDLLPETPFCADCAR